MYAFCNIYNWMLLVFVEVVFYLLWLDVHITKHIDLKTSMDSVLSLLTLDGNIFTICASMIVLIFCYFVLWSQIILVSFNLYIFFLQNIAGVFFVWWLYFCAPVLFSNFQYDFCFNHSLFKYVFTI